MNAIYDFIVIGGGPNGLCTAAYLAKAGQRVLVLEKHFEVGGGLMTEEVTLGGFYHNTHSVYHMMVDYAPPYKDLELEKYRCTYICPELQVAMPFRDGRSLCLYRDVERSWKSIAQFSRRDADTYREVCRKFARMVDDYLAPATYVPPLPPIEVSIGLQKTEISREIEEIQPKSPEDIVNGLFEHERVRTMMLYLATHWGVEHDLPALGFLTALFLNRAVNARLCIGGSHRLSNAMCRVIQESGDGHIRGSQAIKRIVVEGGAAKGVELVDGRIYGAAKGVISSIDPHQTFLKYVGAEHLTEPFAEKIREWKWETWSICSLHLALTELPAFNTHEDISNGFMYILGYETPDDLKAHYERIKEGRLSSDVGADCVFPTMHDPSQAPAGRHTAAMYEMAPYELIGGEEDWWKGSMREEHEEGFVRTLQRYAGNMTRDKVLWTYLATPVDFAAKFPNMVRGSFKQGKYELFQMNTNRPNDECSNNRTPISGLYTCGASNHPGGMVLFGPSYLAVNAIAEDCGIDKWWTEPEHIAAARAKGYFG